MDGNRYNRSGSDGCGGNAVFRVMTSSIQALIARTAPFDRLPADEHNRLAVRARWKTAESGAQLCRQNDSRVDAVYLVENGRLERRYEWQGRSLQADHLEPGDSFGGMSILVNDGIALRTVTVEQRAKLAGIAKVDFLELCSRYPEIGGHFTTCRPERDPDAAASRMVSDRETAVFLSGVVPFSFLPDPMLEALASRLEHREYPKDALLFLEGATRVDHLILIRTGSAERYSQGRSEEGRLAAGDIYGGISMLLNDGIAIQSLRTREKTTCSLLGKTDFLDLCRRFEAMSEFFTDTFGRQMLNPSYAAIIQRTPPSRFEAIPEFEAMLRMLHQDLPQLAGTPSGEALIGMPIGNDRITAPGESPFGLLSEVASADRPEDVFDMHGRLPKILQHWIQAGAKTGIITALITAVSDGILNRLVTFALDDLGPPPVPFVFLILGSEGRREQTLRTDQDNAIVYADTDDPAAQPYFLELGTRVCDWLDQAGYAYCQGGVMAKNRQWCQPLTVWKAYFSDWIRKGEGEALLQASIFFDFRGGYGQPEIVAELRRHLFRSLSGWAGFFRHLTENALFFKPPIGLFRKFGIPSKGDHRDGLDLKSAMMPIVDFARIYALHHRIETTNTTERLRRLREQRVLLAEDHVELEQGYAFLMQLRFARQIRAILEEKRPPDNHIAVKRLSRIEQTTLKAIFKRIETFQSKLSFDFTGMA